MKIEIVKFDNGKYGVRKTQYRYWFNPLLDVHQYLYLRRKENYNVDVDVSAHWNNITIDNAEYYQTASLDDARENLQRYNHLIDDQRRYKRAKKAVKEDKGKVVVV
jgi:hypothetical protein